MGIRFLLLLTIAMIIGFVCLEAQFLYLYICNLKEQKKTDSESKKAGQQDKADKLRRMAGVSLGVFLIWIAPLLSIVLLRYLG